MENNLLRYCPNYNYIMEFFNKGDMVTDKIINVYKVFVMNASKSTRSEIRKIKDLDYVMFLYLDDYLFHDQLKRKYPYLEFMIDNNYINELVDEILKTYNSYVMFLKQRMIRGRYIRGNVSYKY